MNDTLFARMGGSGDKTLVFIHGFGGSHAAWCRIAEAFHHEALVIAYDLPGHGGSLSHPAAGRAGAMAKALVSDLTARGIHRFHLVGHSMGGAVATLIAMNVPERAASLTLLAPGGFGPEINGDLLGRYATARTADELSACLAEMAVPGFVPPAELVEAMLRERAVPGQRDKLVEIAGLIAKDNRQGVIPREALAALAMPVSVLWGTEDAVLPYAQTRDLPAMFGLHSFAGAGHMLPDEHPDEVAALICRESR